MNEIGRRICNLRDEWNLTKRELAARLGISESQLSRIESGKTATLSSDILISLAREFGVSADYILGLSPTKENNHILSELRLSEAACEKLIRREVDGDTLSRLMEQEQFGNLMKLSKAYFTDLYAEGVGYRNAILDSTASFLRDHADETEHPAAVRIKAKDIAHAKTRDHEIELTQIQTLTRKILADAKAQYAQELGEEDPVVKRRSANQAFADHLREIAEEVRGLEGSEEEKLDHLTDRIVEEIQAMTGLHAWAAKQLKPVYRRFIQSAGQSSSGDENEE